MKWYEWLSVFVGMALLAFTIQNFYGAFQEKVVKAAYMFLLLPGVPALILVGLPLARVAIARNKTVNS
ncbi:MAG: dehalogenase [Dehalogenimonas sp.]